jgi:hypothetical protein
LCTSKSGGARYFPKEDVCICAVIIGFVSGEAERARNMSYTINKYNNPSFPTLF